MGRVSGNSRNHTGGTNNTNNTNNSNSTNNTSSIAIILIRMAGLHFPCEVSVLRCWSVSVQSECGTRPLVAEWVDLALVARISFLRELKWYMILGLWTQQLRTGRCGLCVTRSLGLGAHFELMLRCSWELEVARRGCWVRIQVSSVPCKKCCAK